MPAMIYDTLRLAKARGVSCTPEQSETLAQAFSDSTEDSVATKLDIAELKTEIAEVRTELRTEIAALRSEIATLKTDMVRWIVGAIAFNLLATIGVMIAIAELVLKTK